MNLEDKVIKSLYRTTQGTYVVTSVKQNWNKILQNNVLQLTFTIGPFKRHCGLRRAVWPWCTAAMFPSPDNSTALPQSPQFSHPNAPTPATGTALLTTVKSSTSTKAVLHVSKPSVLMFPPSGKNDYMNMIMYKRINIYPQTEPPANTDKKTDMYNRGKNVEILFWLHPSKLQCAASLRKTFLQNHKFSTYSSFHIK